MRNKPLILVVDDLESNLQVAGNILVEAGYEIALIVDGKKAITIAKKIIPDLILLDLVMPDTNGFDVCQALKEDDKTKDIPIIFLTSMKNTDNIVKGLELGAVDYIVKPANKQETLARIKTHLDLKRSQEIIIDQNKQLKELIDEKNAFFSISSNQLMNPINAIRGYNDHIKSYNVKNENSADLRRFTQLIDNEIISVSSTINDFLYLYTLEQGMLPSVTESFNINMLIDKLLEDFAADLKAKRLNISFSSGVDRNIHAVADKEKIEVILQHLISNAIKYSKFYRTINVKADIIVEKKRLIMVEIKDQGVGMSEEDLSKIFTKYSNLSPVPTNNEHSVGIGMPIVKKLTDEMGGRILIESQEGVGTTVKLFIPTI